MIAKFIWWCFDTFAMFMIYGLIMFGRGLDWIVNLFRKNP